MGITAGFSVDVQSYRSVEEIDKDQSNMWIFENVSQTRVYTVAPVFGIGQRHFVDDLHKSPFTKPR